MAVTRAATSRILEIVKDKLNIDDVFSQFHIYTMSDLEEEKYPQMPFIGIKVTEREPDDLFTRSIRRMDVDVIAVIHTKSHTHPHDASLYGWDYAVWLAENLVNFLNAINFGDDVFVIERDCDKDVDDANVDNDLTYVVMTTMDIMFETVAL
jgi:hypothetical protein